MAIQFKTSGTILFTGGVVAMDADCCCEPECVPCCDGQADKTLYLTIDNLTLDAGETCDPGCIPAIDSEPSVDTGGGETECGADSATWNIPPDDTTAANAPTLGCNEEGQWTYSDLVPFRRLGTCTIHIDPSEQVLPGVVCDPFYWEGELTVSVYTTDVPPVLCGTGTIHIIISE